MHWTRRAFLGALVAAPAGAAYARLVEPHWLDVRRMTVKIPDAKGLAPLRVLHLADLHATSAESLTFLRTAIDAGLAERPDVIALTGDFITSRFSDWAAYRELLARLSAAAPTFACLGNHDGGAWAAVRHGYVQPGLVADCLESAGVRLLHNRTVRMPWQGRNLSLTGVGDLWSGDFRAREAFAGAATGEPALRLLLAHNPDSKDQLRDQPWDLMLSGHTHGGQVVIPLVGAPFAPVEDFRYIEGLHTWEDRQLFITRGVGTLHRLRFNCRPEVSVLTVQPA